MNESLKMGRKAFTIAVAVATILWTLGSAALLAPSNASAATPGSLIKGSTLSTVYYYAGDGQRYAFPNEKTYFTWYTDFSGVVALTDSELAAIPLGGNIVYRPGSHWIKIQSDPKTYAVTPQGQIRWIESETVAVGLAGSDWNTFIDDVPDVFFVDYTVGTSLMTAEDAYNGALVAGSTLLVWDGKVYNVTDAGMTANRFQSRFVLDGTGIDLSGMTSGGDLATANSAMIDTAQLGGVITGGLSVSLASDTPASATIPAGAASVPFTIVKLMATSGSATVDQLVFKLGGVGGVGNVDNVYLYEDGTRLTKGRSVNASTREVTFSALGLAFASGESMYLTVRADASDAPTGGDTASFYLASASSVTGTATVSGTFPVMGNTMTFSETEAGDVVISETGTISDPVIGQEEAVIAKFRAAADGEDASLEAISLDVDDAGDHSNFNLWNSDDKIAACEALDNLVTCELTNPLSIEDGDNEVLELTADIGGENGDLISVAVDEEADVVATGGDFGFNLAVDITDYDDTSCDDAGDFCSLSEVQGGDLTFAFNGPTSGDILIDGTDQILFEFTITAQNWTSIEELGVEMDFGTCNEGFLTGGDPNIDDVTIRTAAGTTWMGPEAIDDGLGACDAQDFLFDDTQTLDAGESLDLMITVDVENNEDLEGDTLFATLIMAEVVAEDVNGDAIGNIVPGADMVGNEQELVLAGLDVTVSTPPNSGTYVKGVSNIDVVGFSFSAGNASDVTLTDLLIWAQEDTPGQDVEDYVNSCSLYDKTTGSLVDGPKSPDADDENFDFDNFDWTVEAGETGKLLVRCNFANVDPAAATDVYMFWINDEDDILAEDADGNPITANLIDGNDLPDVEISIVENGDISFALDGSTPASTIILGSATDVTVGVWEFDASEEGFTVTDLTLEDNGDDDVAAAVTVSYKNAAGTTKEKTGYFAGGLVTFSGLDFWVASDEKPNLTVMIDVNSVSATATPTGDTILVELDGDRTFKAIGAASGEAIVEGGDLMPGDDFIPANEMVVRKTKPTLSLASGSPSGSGVPGLSEIFRFNASADSRGDVTLEDMMFKMSSAANNVGRDWNECDVDGAGLPELAADAMWEMYNSDDPSTKVDDDWNFWDDDGDVCVVQDEKIQWVQVEFDPFEEIAAGDTNTYVVRLDTTAASAADDDSIRLDIPDQDDVEAAGGTAAAQEAVSWQDGEDGGDGGTDVDVIDGEFLKNLPVTGGTIVY